MKVNLGLSQQKLYIKIMTVGHFDIKKTCLKKNFIPAIEHELWE
ncbi:MAG: hypothetical protein ACJARX_000455 [Psychroserpens sp.]|jgi:hypothetical protein